MRFATYQSVRFTSGQKISKANYAVPNSSKKKKRKKVDQNLCFLEELRKSKRLLTFTVVINPSYLKLANHTFVYQFLASDPISQDKIQKFNKLYLSKSKWAMFQSNQLTRVNVFDF